MTKSLLDAVGRVALHIGGRLAVVAVRRDNGRIQ